MFSMLNEGTNELVKRKIKEERKKMNENNDIIYCMWESVSRYEWTLCSPALCRSSVFLFHYSCCFFPFFCSCFACDFHLNFSISVSHTYNKRIFNVYEKRWSKYFGITEYSYAAWPSLVWPVFKYVMLFPLFIIFIQVFFHSTNYNTKQNVFVIFELSGGWFFGWAAVSPGSGKCIGYTMGNCE